MTTTYLSKEKEDQQKILFIEALSVMNDIIKNYIDRFFSDRTKHAYVIDRLTKVSASAEIERDYVNQALNNTVDVLKEFEYNFVGDLGDMKTERKKLEQIVSILKVGIAYPDNALKRLKSLRPKMVIKR